MDSVLKLSGTLSYTVVLVKSQPWVGEGCDGDVYGREVNTRKDPKGYTLE
jgi:hypothetical protein